MQEIIPSALNTPLLQKLISAGIGLAIILSLLALARRYAAGHVQNIDTRYKLRKALNFAGYLATFLVLLVSFSDRLSTLGVALGMAGAGVAFALQEVIASIAGWTSISFGSLYSVGDRIQLGGITGDVIDVGMLRTTLMETGQWIKADQYNGRIVRVANSFVFKEPVVNYSADFPFLWDEIVFPVRYGSDWKYAREALARAVQDIAGDYAQKSLDSWKKVVRKYRIEDLDISPRVSLKADENWISFTLRYIVDYRKRGTVKDALYTRIIETVDASAGRINIASAAFEVLTLPKVKLEIEGHSPAPRE